MGSKPKPQPTSYYQQVQSQQSAPEPQLYVSYTPTRDLKAVAEATRRYGEEAEQIRQHRFSTLGTDADRAARAAGIRSQEAASYLASLPKGAFAAQEQAASGLSQAQADYGKALQAAETTPAPTAPEWQLPQWAMTSRELRAFKKTDAGKEFYPEVKKGKFVDPSQFS